MNARTHKARSFPRRRTHPVTWHTTTAELTQHVAQKRRRRVCASWGLLLLCTPWQNTHVLVSGNMQTSWPGRGGGSHWRSQRSASHTSDWKQTEGKGPGWGGGRGRETVTTVLGVFMTSMSFVMWLGHMVEITEFCYERKLPLNFVPCNNVSLLQGFDGIKATCIFVLGQ